MLSSTLTSPQSLAATLATLFLTWCIVERLIISAKLAGRPGIRASIDGGNPITAIMHLWRFGAAQNKRKIPEFFDDMYGKADPSSPWCTEILIAGRRILLTAEPGQIKAMLATQFDQFGKGERFRRIWSPFLGESIFATDDAKWHANRKLLRPMFNKERLSDLKIFERHTQILLSQLPSSGQTVDMGKKFNDLTMDVITDFLMGRAVGSLENPQNEFAQTFGIVQTRQVFRAIIWPLRWFLPKDHAYFNGIDVMDRIVDPYIDEAMAMSQDELKVLSESGEELSFLQNIALQSKDRKVMRDQIIAVLLAGRDTSGASLSWALYELSHYPEEWAKLRKEVLSMVGPETQPTYQDLKDMKYLQYILHETLRLHPSIPFNVRTCFESTTLPGYPGQPDILVNEGDTIIYVPLTMQRRRDLYPPVSEDFADPAIFSPSRWFKWTPEPWHLIPFNGGPRICLGQNFALTELAFVLVRLSQKYERVEYQGDWDAQFIKTDIVGKPGQGVPVAFFEPGK
ncbi:cytochrome P450 [Sarocladium strictum]